ncbi:MAG: orotidine-5'-phosphate decarboxylase [Bacteroidota bacterium]
MNRQQLVNHIYSRGSFLCVGLDTDIQKLPAVLKSESDPVFAFNKAIIDATRHTCVAYKLNTAFYEASGYSGWHSMEKTVQYIGDSHFIIADAKRGDIGNTSHQYAKAFFETLACDAVTLAPYMGRDSIAPFFEYENKWGIVLALTSNAGSADYEQLMTGNERVYERVIKTTCELGNQNNLMFVAGATKAEELSHIRKIIPNHFLLVPGVGAQGGSLHDVARYGMNEQCGLLVNASRSIIYASAENDFANAARKEAEKTAAEMKNLLEEYGTM